MWLLCAPTYLYAGPHLASIFEYLDGCMHAAQVAARMLSRLRCAVHLAATRLDLYLVMQVLISVLAST